MERFYLDNVEVYDKLLKRLMPPPSGPRGKPDTAAKVTHHPDMIVSARIRPFLEEDIAAGFPNAMFPRKLQKGAVDVHDLYNHPRGRPVIKSSNYEVDKLYGTDATTETIYDDLVADLVTFAQNGGIGTLFAYGQTGSGKTYTISRFEELAIESLMSGNDSNNGTTLSLTIVELAGNSAFNLLSSREPITIRDDSFGVTHLFGAAEIDVSDMTQVRTLIEQAASFRRSAPTMKNSESSRSHAICRVRVTHPPSSKLSDGFLYLIDLAGSEAARDLATHGAERMRETREINMSLSVLKDCIRGKAELDALKQSAKKTKSPLPRVPFRQSALTRILKHVFDPATTEACKTAVIACVNPSLADVGATKNTLRYAELLRVMVPADGEVKAKKVDNDPLVPSTWDNTHLRQWITDLCQSSEAASILAPTENGTQFLRLSSDEVDARSQNTSEVSPGQVDALRSKLWALHIDSRNITNGKSSTSTTNGNGTQAATPPPAVETNGRSARSSSKVLHDAASDGLIFTKRIRPGMAIKYKPSPDTNGHGSDQSVNETLIAVVLSPMTTTTGPQSNGTGPVQNGNHADKPSSYICAALTPAQVPDSYELQLWQQSVVSTDMMETEVILEYDAQSRYYYVAEMADYVWI